MSDSQTGMKLTALAVQDVAKLLSKAANKAVPVELIQADIAAGAPVNPDGTINLISYAGWLVIRVADAD